MFDITAFAYINDTAGKQSLTLQPHPVDICLSKVVTGLVAIEARTGAPERRAGPGDLMLLQNTPGVQVGSSDQCDRLSVFLQGGRLSARLERLLGRTLGKKLRFAPPDCWSQGAAASIIRAIDFVAAELASLFATGVGVAHFEEMLGLQLLHGAPHNYAEAMLQRRTLRPATGTKRAEAFMRENLDRPISAADIAAAANCSTCSILNAFRSDHDRAVVSFLRDLRPDAARRDLLAGAHAVTVLARRHGFSNPNRLPAHCRMRFGESPAETSGGPLDGTVTS